MGSYKIRAQIGATTGTTAGVPDDWSESGYLADNPDVANAVKSGQLSSGWGHYSEFGKKEGRSYTSADMPSDWDEWTYRNQNPDVDAAIKSGSVPSGYKHYVWNGKSEGRQYAKKVTPVEQLTIPGDWDEGLYITNNPDVAIALAAGQVPSGYWHYFNFGKAEGRKYASKPMPEITVPPAPAIRKIKATDKVVKGELFVIECWVASVIAAGVVGEEIAVDAYPGMKLQKGVLYRATGDMSIVDSVTSVLRTAAKSGMTWGILGVTAAVATGIYMISRRKK